MRVAGIYIFLLVLSTLPAASQDGPQTSLASTSQRADAGDAQAQFELGRAYEDGKGVPQDDTHAVAWFRKSADQGRAQAQNSLGVMYALGRGVSRDKEEAVNWYKKAAKQGLPEALYNVAISYYNGEGVAGDVNRAYTWMLAAQRRGEPQAAEALQHISEEMHNRFDRSKFDLAGLYEKGEEIPQDLSAAVALYMEAAQQDNRQSAFASPAQYKLCQLYATGKGVPQDYAQAKSWCRKSDLSFAYVALGRMAEKGLGQDKNPQEALDFYRNAAVLGSPDGFLNAGRLEIESGSHDGQKRAYFLYAIAAKLKLPGAAEKLHEAAAYLSEKEIVQQQKQIQDWFKLPPAKRAAELKKH